MDQKKDEETIELKCKEQWTLESLCVPLTSDLRCGAVCTELPFDLFCLFSASHTWFLRKMTEDIAF